MTEDLKCEPDVPGQTKKSTQSIRAYRAVDDWYKSQDSPIDFGQVRGAFPKADKERIARKINVTPLLLSKAWQVYRRRLLGAGGITSEVIDEILAGNLAINTVTQGVLRFKFSRRRRGLKGVIRQSLLTLSRWRPFQPRGTSAAISALIFSQ